MMQSRVRRRRRSGFTPPPSLGGIAALTVADQHQAGCAPRFRCQLQTAARCQRQGLLWFGDDQGDGGCTQRLFNAPEQISLAFWGQQHKPFCQTMRQPPQHRPLRLMCRQHPKNRAGMTQGLKQCKGASSRSFDFMHATGGQAERVCRCRAMCKITQGRHGHPPARYPVRHPAADVADAARDQLVR